MPSVDDRRRELLKVLASGGVVTVAGCSVGQGDGDDGGTSPENGGDATPTPTEGSDGGDGTDGSDGGDGSDGSDGTDGDQPAAVTLDSVRVGALTNQTAPGSYLFVSGDKAVDLAIEEIREAGGPLGADVSLGRQDTTLKLQQSRNAMTQMIHSNNAAFIHGITSGTVAASSEWVVEQEVPHLTGYSTTPFLSTFGGDGGDPDDLSNHEWVWRTIAGDGLTQIGATRFALEEKGWEKLGVFHGSNSAMFETAEGFVEAFEASGGEIVERIALDPESSNYQPSLDRMPFEEIDALWMYGALEYGILFMRQFGNSSYGDTPAILGQWALPSEFVSQTREVLAGNEVFSTSGTPATDSERYQAFKQKFEEQYPDTEWYEQFTGPQYDATNIGFLALHRAGTLGDLSQDPEIEEVRRAIERNIGRVARPPGTEVQTFPAGKDALDNGEEINYQGSYSTDDFTGNGNVFANINVHKFPGPDQDSWTVDTVYSEEQLAELATNY